MLALLGVLNAVLRESILVAEVFQFPNLLLLLLECIALVQQILKL